MRLKAADQERGNKERENGRNTELKQKADVMMAREKRIYVLMIKVNKFFSFFRPRVF